MIYEDRNSPASMNSDPRIWRGLRRAYPKFILKKINKKFEQKEEEEKEKESTRGCLFVYKPRKVWPKVKRRTQKP